MKMQLSKPIDITREITKPQDDPQCREMLATMERLQTEQIETIQRKGEIEAILARPRNLAGANAWDHAMAGEGAWRTDERKELQEEFQFICDREQFINAALEQGRQALDTLIGRLSLKPCEAVRPLFVKQINRILSGFKEICDAIELLQDLREGLEQDGIRSGSIPSAIPINIGSWDDPQSAGMAYSYRQWIKTNFPEAQSD